MLEDRRLLRRLRRGDKDALRRIYEKYEGRRRSNSTSTANKFFIAPVHS